MVARAREKAQAEYTPRATATPPPLWLAALAVSAALGDFPPHPWGWLVILAAAFLTKWPSQYDDHTAIGHAIRKLDRL